MTFYSYHGRLPLVTIGMPVRNGNPYFEQALASVLSQDYPNLEILISDNCSTDDTAVIAGHALAIDVRVRIFRQPNTITAFDNFAWVLKEARGQYFMWAAHDDLRPKNYVSSLVACLEKNPSVILAFGDLKVSQVFGEGYSEKFFDYETFGMSRLLRVRKTAFMQCYHIYGLWRRDMLVRIPFIFNSWWPDLPLMIAAASMGEFCRLSGLNFNYLEIRKSNEQRAKYQDNNVAVNRVGRTIRLFKVVFQTVYSVSGWSFAFLATFFVIEKQFWLGLGLMTGRIKRGN